MKEDEALAKISVAGRNDAYFIVPHARFDRMPLRGVQAADIRHGLEYARSAKRQPNGRWRVETVDRTGDALTLIVELTPAVVVVTVF